MGNLNCGKSSHDSQKEINFHKSSQNFNGPKIFENKIVNFDIANFNITQIFVTAPNLSVKNISISNKDFINKEEIKIIQRGRFYTNDPQKLNSNINNINFLQKKSSAMVTKENNSSTSKNIKKEKVNDNCIIINEYNKKNIESLHSESKTIYNNDSKDIICNSSYLIEQDNGKINIIEHKNEEINAENNLNINNNINSGIENRYSNEIENKTIKLFKKVKIKSSPLEIICENEDDKKIVNTQTDEEFNSKNISIKNNIENNNDSMSKNDNKIDLTGGDGKNLKEKNIFEFEEVNNEYNQNFIDEKQIKSNYIETILINDNQKSIIEENKNKLTNANKNITLNKIEDNNSSMSKDQLDNNNYNKIVDIYSINKNTNLVNKDNQMEEDLVVIKNNENKSNNHGKLLNNNNIHQEINNNVSINDKNEINNNLNKLDNLEKYPQQSLLEFQNMRNDQLIFYQFHFNNLYNHFCDNRNNFRYKNNFNNEDGIGMRYNNENEVNDNNENNLINKNDFQANTNNKYCKTLSKNKSIKTKNTHISNKELNWKDISIYSVIPKEKYLSYKETDILLKGEFVVVNNSLLQNHTISTNREKYKRYLTLAKTELKVYRNKEKYICDENPLNSISLFNISKCDIYQLTTSIAQSNNVLFNYNFYIKLTTVNGMMMKNNQINSNNPNKKYHHLNKSANFPKKKQVKFTLTNKMKDSMLKCFCKHKDIELINLIDNEKGLDNNEVNNLRCSCRLKDSISKKENYEIIVLSSENKKLLYTWVALINHLIK